MTIADMSIGQTGASALDLHLSRTGTRPQFPSTPVNWPDWHLLPSDIASANSLYALHAHGTGGKLTVFRRRILDENDVRTIDAALSESTEFLYALVE